MSYDTYSQQGKNNILEIVKLLFRNIWIIIPFVIIAVGIAYLYNKYTISSWYVSSTLLINEDSRSRSNNYGPNFINNDLLSRTQNLQNELKILQSLPLIEQTLKNLDLEVTYYEYRDYQYYNAYKTVPFKVFIFKDHPQLTETIFDILFKSDGSYEIVVEKQNATIFNYATYQKTGAKEDLELRLKGNIGEVLETTDLKLLITLNEEENLQWHEERNFAFKLTNIGSLANQFKYELNFSTPDRLATVVEIGMESSSVKLAEDVINELMNVYISSKLEEKNHLANVTLDYIEEQLTEVSSSLSATENNLERFKAANRAMNVDEQASRLSEQQLQLQNQLAELMIQKRYFNYIKENNLGNSDESHIITPASMGVNDPVLNRLIDELSTAQTQLDNLIKNNQERNPMVNRLTVQIRNLYSTISENIASAESANDLAISEIQDRISQLDSSIRRLPSTQLQLGGIERNFNLNDAIYNYLLEKQAEARITKASNLSDIVILEPAHLVGSSPVRPNRKLNYLISLFLGFSIPVMILLIKLFFKTTITKQEEIEAITNAPILGKVLHYKNQKEKNVFLTSPGNKTAENFRTLRTNLNFAMGNKAGKTILVSSCVSGEGKTFSSLNIAAAFAQIDKKVILINFDLRNSHAMFKNADNKKGLSMFLANENSLEEIIQKSYFKNLDLINSGPVPPNPLELIESERTDTLFETLKKNYDYIIIDTPPVAQVSDAFAVIKHADLNLIVVRYNITKKKLLRLVLSEIKNKNIRNVYIILNDNKQISEQMGYGYYNKN